MFIGASNVVPGISGGTVAVILGVFDPLIQAINDLFKRPKSSFHFLVTVGIGMLFGILLLGSLIDYLFRLYSFQTGCFLAGLVAGSVPLVYKKARNYPAFATIDFRMFFLTFLGILAVVLITLFKTAPEVSNNISLNLNLICLLFVGGFFAAAMMIIPGISGAFILMLFGIYSLVISVIVQIKDFILSPTDLEMLPAIFSVLIPLGCGVLAGILVMTRFLGYLLKKYHSPTYFLILGLIIGTIFSVLIDPLTHQSYDTLTLPILLSGIFCSCLGTLIVIRVN